MIECINGFKNIIRSQFGYDVYAGTMDGNVITHKFKQEASCNTGKAVQAFDDFLSSKAAAGLKYTNVESYWKRKPKLDYLDLNSDKRYRQQTKNMGRTS
eukprot:12857580-Ditylum_brightwellii.AAC.1